MTAGDLSLLTLDETIGLNSNPLSSNREGIRTSSGKEEEEPDLLSLDNPFLASPTPPSVSVLFDAGEEKTRGLFEETWVDFERKAEGKYTRGWAACKKERLVEALLTLGLQVGHREGVTSSEGFEQVVLYKEETPVVLLELKDSTEGGSIWKMLSQDRSHTEIVRGVLDSL